MCHCEQNVCKDWHRILSKIGFLSIKENISIIINKNIHSFGFFKTWSSFHYTRFKVCVGGGGDSSSTKSWHAKKKKLQIMKTLIRGRGGGGIYRYVNFKKNVCCNKKSPLPSSNARCMCPLLPNATCLCIHIHYRCVVFVFNDICIFFVQKVIVTFFNISKHPTFEWIPINNLLQNLFSSSERIV